MNDIFSFYQLTRKYQIEIPIIQRDYAQGRNTPKAKDVRKSMVTDLIKAVKGEKQLFFDFVYGRIEGEKFIPFDGQQRLTTLFLFHKYVFEKCYPCIDCLYKGSCGFLQRFSYFTRQSSREFCEKLVMEKIIPNEAEENLTSFVINQSWFYSDWIKDPTIMGMLTTLEEIHNQFQQVKIDDFKPLAEKLTRSYNCPITFHFVDMGKHKLSDETYVKMNARGKTLTPFENFKASLEKYLKDKDMEKKENEKKDERPKETIYAKLLERFRGTYHKDKNKYSGVDGDWLYLFWDVVNKGKEEKEEKELPDNMMMSFCNRHFMNVWRCWYGQHKKTEKEREELSDEENEKLERDDYFNNLIDNMPLYPTKDDFVSWDIYQYVLDRCGSQKCLTPIFNIWDKLCEESNKNDFITEACQAVWNRGESEKKWNLYKGIENDKNSEEYSSRIAFFALLRYFEDGELDDLEPLEQWMRVVWNIIENSTIDDDSYQAALRLIDKMSTKSHNIYEGLNDFSAFKLGGQHHAQSQVKEEIAKAKQILDESGNLRKHEGSCKKEDGSAYHTWEEIINDAEKLYFFKGAIAFLFNDVNGQPTAWNHFDHKLEIAKQIFDAKGLRKDYLINTLLCLYSYCDQWDDQLWWSHKIFNGLATTWKENILTLTDRNRNYQYVYASPVHHILMGYEPRNRDEINDNRIKTLANCSLIEYIIN